MAVTPRAVDHLNVGLMIASLAVAFALPFELFLFSYAVLGPLHYLTEISWLHERQYFTHGKRDGWILGLLALLGVLGTPAVLGRWHVEALAPYGQQFVFLAFAWALVFVVLRGTMTRWLAAIAILVLMVPFTSSAPHAWFLFGLFVTTILHVCVFTGAFMLFGALRARSTSGYLACGMFAVCCVLALAVPAGPGSVTTYVRESYLPFAALNQELGSIFGLGTSSGPSAFASQRELFTSGGGVIVMRFIAFAYTYHYLNWFSKTSIIGWHKVDRRKLAVAVVIWVASLALYARSYELGLRWLFLLSFAHVLLEFPLNHMSFLGIGRELRQRFGASVPKRPGVQRAAPAGAARGAKQRS